MRNALKIFHWLFVVGMVPLLFWSGLPQTGCACASETVKPKACGCCAQVQTEEKKSCCCRAKKPSEDPVGASIGSVIPQTELGLLVPCGCGQNVSPHAVTIQWERKTVSDDFASPEAKTFAAFQAHRPRAKTIVESSFAKGDADRVILFCALLI